jgi:hypothetical protein
MVNLSYQMRPTIALARLIPYKVFGVNNCPDCFGLEPLPGGIRSQVSASVQRFNQSLANFWGMGRRGAPGVGIAAAGVYKMLS